MNIPDSYDWKAENDPKRRETWIEYKKWRETQTPFVETEPEKICVCCSLGSHSFDLFAPCGHAFCYICTGRGHDEDCIKCETNNEGGEMDLSEKIEDTMEYITKEQWETVTTDEMIRLVVNRLGSIADSLWVLVLKKNGEQQ